MAILTDDHMIVKKMGWHSTMTDTNHLGAALRARPEKLRQRMLQMFSSFNYSDNPITSMLISTGRTEEISGVRYEWELQGAESRPLVVVDNVIPVSNVTPGYGGIAVQVAFDVPWCIPGDIIHPGDMAHKARVMEQPRKHAKGWLYTLKAVNPSHTRSFLVESFSEGTKWGKLYSTYEEGAEQMGSTLFRPDPQILTNRLTMLRKHFKVTGYAQNQVLAAQIPDSKGALHKMWMNFAESEFWHQWARELERSLWYGEANNGTILGSTGRPVYSGAGLQQQIATLGGHVHNYNTLSGKLLQEFTMDIFYGRVKPGAQRKLKVFTGEYGMIAFHNAVMSELQKTGFLTVSEFFIDKSKSPYHDNGLAFGAQFHRYRMANGAEIEVIHNPLYDDRSLHWKIDPVTGFPEESMRFTFLDFSGEGTESNIKMINQSNGFKLNYVEGTASPFGPNVRVSSAHHGDYYSMGVQDSLGANIADATRTGELILLRS